MPFGNFQEKKSENFHSFFDADASRILMFNTERFFQKGQGTQGVDIGEGSKIERKIREVL